MARTSPQEHARGVRAGFERTASQDAGYGLRQLADVANKTLSVGIDDHGISNAEIAETLTIGDATVKTHIARIFGKLYLHDRAQAPTRAASCNPATQPTQPLS